MVKEVIIYFIDNIVKFKVNFYLCLKGLLFICYKLLKEFLY